MSQGLNLEHISLTIEDGVACVDMNRPAQRNALSPELIHSLTQCFLQIGNDPAIRIIILRGSGVSFCVGFDLLAMSGLFVAPGGPDEASIRETALMGRRLIDAVRNSSAITIAQIHGHAVGGGFLLAAACDLCVAAENTVMSIPEIDVGLPLLWGGVPLVFSQLGPALARDLILTGRRFTPTEIALTGFPHRIAPEAELAKTQEALTATLAAKPAPALLAIKKQFKAVEGRVEVDDVSLFEETALHPQFLEGALKYIQSLKKRT